MVWKAPLGPSFSSFAVSESRLFSFTQRKVDGADREVAVALDAKTGRELWATPIGDSTFDSNGDGPRSTPTVDGDRVYYLGAYQVLSCLDATNGKVVWQHDLAKEQGGRVPKWNNAASPALDDGLVFVNAGGRDKALMASDKRTGAVVWTGQSDLPTHATPTPATILGVHQVVFLTQEGLVSVQEATGRVLWRYQFPFKSSTASSPVVWQDMVYCSAGYNIGAAAVRVTRSGSEFTVEELWRREGQLMNHWMTPVCRDGYLYGIYGHRQLGTAPLKCVELATGREMWSQPGFGTGGSAILVENGVLVQADRGSLVLVEATSKAYHEMARAQILGGKCWSMPAVSDGRLFIRNDKEAACLDVTVRE